MSLINQMLRDLEQRQSTQVAQAQVAAVGVPGEPDSGVQGLPKPLLWGLAGCVLLLMSWQLGPTLFAHMGVVKDASEPKTAPAKAVPANPETQNELAKAPVSATRDEPAEQAKKQQRVVGVVEASSEKVRESQQPAVEAALTPPEEVEESLPEPPPAANMEPKVAKQRYTDPAEQARLLMNTAQQQLLSGQVVTAIESLKQAVKLQPAWSEPRTQLVTLYKQQGRWLEADLLLEEALKAEPQSAYWALMRARGLWQQQDIERAITVLEKARTDGANDLNLDLFLATLYQRGKQHKASAAAYQDILGHHPGHAKAWLGLAISLQALQQPKDALAAFQQALRSGSHEPKVRQYIEQRIAALQT